MKSSIPVKIIKPTVKNQLTGKQLNYIQYLIKSTNTEDQLIQAMGESPKEGLPAPDMTMAYFEKWLMETVDQDGANEIIEALLEISNDNDGAKIDKFGQVLAGLNYYF